jgi:hypothetical protein
VQVLADCTVAQHTHCLLTCYKVWGAACRKLLNSRSDSNSNSKQKLYKYCGEYRPAVKVSTL